MNELIIPVPGLEADERTFELGGLTFARLELEHWMLIEKNWLVDLYQDHYAARPRFYVLWPLDDAETDLERALPAPVALLERVLLAARLAAPGTLVGPRTTTPVLRSGGLNTRLVDPFRYRLYGTVFGEPSWLPAKKSELAERARATPPRSIASSGPAYKADAAARAAIEALLAQLVAAEQCGAAAHVAWVTRSFTRGQDVFLPLRQRLACLFGALEATLGSYRRPKQQPSLGGRVQALFDRYAPQPRALEQRVETRLREARNALAHGADHRRGVNLAEVVDEVSEILRVAVPVLLRVATAIQLRKVSAAVDEESERTVPGDVLVGHLDGPNVAPAW